MIKKILILNKLSTSINNTIVIIQNTIVLLIEGFQLFFYNFVVDLAMPLALPMSMRDGTHLTTGVP